MWRAHAIAPSRLRGSHTEGTCACYIGNVDTEIQKCRQQSVVPHRWFKSYTNYCLACGIFFLSFIRRCRIHHHIAIPLIHIKFGFKNFIQHSYHTFKKKRKIHQRVTKKTSIIFIIVFCVCVWPILIYFISFAFLSVNFNCKSKEFKKNRSMRFLKNEQFEKNLNNCYEQKWIITSDRLKSIEHFQPIKESVIYQTVIAWNKTCKLVLLIYFVVQLILVKYAIKKNSNKLWACNFEWTFAYHLKNVFFY